MALYPWRFQAEVAKGETDPLVTVFMGPERFALDDDGNPTTATFIQQDTTNPVLMPLSELAAALADPQALAATRKAGR